MLSSSATDSVFLKPLPVQQHLLFSIFCKKKSSGKLTGGVALASATEWPAAGDHGLYFVTVASPVWMIFVLLSHF